MPFGTLAQPLAAPTRAVSRMEKFIIEGGYPLSGTVVPAGNKNAALPLLAASLLAEEEVVLRNVPRIRDVEAMLQLLMRLGVKTSWLEDSVVSLTADDVDPPATWTPRGPSASGPRSCSPARCWPAAAGPKMPVPGGDVIGRRRLDPHLDAFEALGAAVHVDRGYRIEAPGGLRACDFFMDEPSVMATENAIIRGAHARQHGDPQRRLRAPRAGPGPPGDADGRGDRGDRLQPPDRERPGASRRGNLIGPDHIEVASFIALAACSGGERGSRTPSPSICA